MRRAALLVLAAATLLAAPAPSRAGAPERAAASYLLRAQNPDGGLGGERGKASDPMFTGWAALGLAAAGHNPRQVSRNGRSILDYLRSRHRSLDDAGALERTLLILRASGLGTSLAGRDLRAELLQHRRPDGSFDGLVNLTAFGILALRAHGEPSEALQDSVAWLLAQQNADGGYGFAPRAKSDTDDTAAVLQALAAVGQRGSAVSERAVDYLLAAQNRDGGFGSAHSASPNDSNSMSTAWAAQGLLAAGRDPGAVTRAGRTPLDYLRSMQQPGGYIRHSPTEYCEPVWVTGQALLALHRKPFPLEPVALRSRASPAPSPRSRRAPALDRTAAPSRPEQAPASPPRAPTFAAADGRPGAATGAASARPRAATRGARDRGRPKSTAAPPHRAEPRASANRPTQVPPRREAAPDPAWSVIAALALASLVLLAELAWWRSRPRPTRAAVPPPEPIPYGAKADLPDGDADPLDSGADSVDREVEELVTGR